MTDRHYQQDRPEVGISHPGYVDLDERQHGYRHAIAVAWRAIRDALTADECRTRLVELGQAPAPDLSGPPRSGA